MDIVDLINKVPWTTLSTASPAAGDDHEHHDQRERSSLDKRESEMRPAQTCRPHFLVDWHRRDCAPGLGGWWYVGNVAEDTRMGKHKRRWRPDTLEVVPGDTDALRAWAEKAIYWDPGEFDWCSDPRERLHFIDRLAQLTTEEISLAPDEWDRLLCGLSFYAAEIIIRSGVELSDRVRLVRSLAAVLLKITPRVEGESEVLMFWDTIISFYYNHSLGPEEVSALRGTFFDALAEQLRQPNKALQMSALHGLNHLEEPGTADLVASLRDHFADDEVRLFSNAAAAFALP
jgi:hypothetical protein